jgi:pyruvate/2-oxoacid:ferredoxin oxidoreductase beta subunit
MANDTHTVKAFREAEAYAGPSLILAYSHCIAHGYDMAHGLNQQKLAVQSGYWPLLRYNPDLRKEGKNPFQLDSKKPRIPPGARRRGTAVVGLSVPRGHAGSRVAASGGGCGSPG